MLTYREIAAHSANDMLFLYHFGFFISVFVALSFRYAIENIMFIKTILINNESVVVRSLQL